jgi:hypothetical protein
MKHAESCLCEDCSPFRVSEQRKIDRWRLEELERAGFPEPLAELVAFSEADLHQAVDLIRNGCEPTLAAQIVL